MVPRPKEIMVSMPFAGLRVLAAVISMAQVRPQGNRPAARPSPIREVALVELASRPILLPREDGGVSSRTTKEGIGKARRITSPSAKSRMPARTRKLPRYCMENR